jgi:hypothetical protein
VPLNILTIFLTSSSGDWNEKPLRFSMGMLSLSTSSTLSSQETQNFVKILSSLCSGYHLPCHVKATWIERNCCTNYNIRGNESGCWDLKVQMISYREKKKCGEEVHSPVCSPPVSQTTGMEPYCIAIICKHTLTISVQNSSLSVRTYCDPKFGDAPLLGSYPAWKPRQ